MQKQRDSYPNVVIPNYKPENSEFWLASDIKERGWTDAMIRDFLGEPDERRNSAMYRGTVYRLYLKTRVDAAEKTEEFAAWMSKLRKRRAKAAEEKEEKIFRSETEKLRKSQMWDIVESDPENLSFSAKMKHCGCVWQAKVSEESCKWRAAANRSEENGFSKSMRWNTPGFHRSECRFRNGEPLFKPDFKTDRELWCAMDMEIAAPESEPASICDVGIAVFNSEGELVDSRSWNVKPPGNRYEKAVVKEVGLDPARTENSPEWHEISQEIEDFVGGMPIVCHAVENEMLQLCGYEKGWIPDASQMFCSQRLAYFLFPNQKMGLKSLCENRSIPLISHHDSLCDATATGWLWQHLAGSVKNSEKDVFDYFRSQFLPEGWLFKGLPASQGQRQYLAIIYEETGIKPSVRSTAALEEKLEKLLHKQEEASHGSQKIAALRLEKALDEIYASDDKKVPVSWFGVYIAADKPENKKAPSAYDVIGGLTRAEAAKILDVGVKALDRHREKYGCWYDEY